MFNARKRESIAYGRDRKCYAVMFAVASPVRVDRSIGAILSDRLFIRFPFKWFVARPNDAR